MKTFDKVSVMLPVSDPQLTHRLELSRGTSGLLRVEIQTWHRDDGPDGEPFRTEMGPLYKLAPNLAKHYCCTGDQLVACLIEAGFEDDEVLDEVRRDIENRDAFPRWEAA